MTTITKERVAEIIHAAGLEPCDYEEVFGSIKTGEIVAMARIALASLEAEAVAYMHHSGQVVTREECCDDKIFAICCKVETPLYAAPRLPQPAVVDADDNFYSWFCREWEQHYQPNQYSTSAKQHLGAIAESAWFACRAAMLQGKADGNSPVIQDGWVMAPKEATAEMINSAMRDNETGGLDEIYELMIAAAPQQEVKK